MISLSDACAAAGRSEGALSTQSSRLPSTRHIGEFSTFASAIAEERNRLWKSNRVDYMVRNGGQGFGKLRNVPDFLVCETRSRISHFR